MRRPGNALRLSVPALVVSALFGLGCGGKQAVPEPMPATEPECCFDERWAEPPPEFGQTPPPTSAAVEALDAFTPPGAEP